MKRYLVIGDPIAHSLSPVMHRAAFAASGIEGTYDPVRVPSDQLSDSLQQFWEDGVQGINVTLPHKEALLTLCAEVDKIARSVGAVNTLWRGERGWSGTNTDAEGFVRSLRDEARSRPTSSTTPQAHEHGTAGTGARVASPVAGGSDALVLGAGGAARAVVVGLRAAGVDVAVSARRPDAAEALQPLGATVVPWGAPLEATFVVNATSASLHDGEGFAQALPFENHSGQTFVDLVYTPRETPFLRRAREHGAATVDGSGMLLHQGAIAFERWHGVGAPLDAMRRALDDALAAN